MGYFLPEIFFDKPIFSCNNHRWMIELPPARNSPAIRNITNLAVTSHRVNSSEIVDHIYDIIEKLQKICFNMNLFFGKKVRRGEN